MSGFSRAVVPSLCLVCGLAGGLLPSAWAQSETSTATSAVGASDDRWVYNIGLGVGVMPKYAGSDQRVGFLGVTGGATKGRFTIGNSLPGEKAQPFGLGYRFYDDEHCHVGAGLTLGSGRSESEAPRLQGMGDVHVSPNAYAQAICTVDHARVIARWETDVSGNHGSTLNVDALARVALRPGLVVYAGPGLTWGSSQHNQTFFGVSAQQSANTGLAAHDAASGVNALRLSAGVSYRIDPQWSLEGGLTASQLQGDADNSPITQKRSATSGGVMAFYRF